ncbi:MAG: glycosyltransferase family 4 protein [Thermoanaerobaculia bacterium]
MARIVLIVPAFPKLSESFLFEKFRRLREAGWDVWVVCRRSARSEWANFTAQGEASKLAERVRVCWPQQPKWLAALLAPAAILRCLARNPAAAWRYLRGPSPVRRLYADAELLCLAPDVVHFEFGALAVGRMHLAKFLRCRTLVSFRGYDLNASGLGNPDYYRDVWKKADAFHFLGEDLRRRARDGGWPEEKPHALIPPAVDERLYRPREGDGREKSGNAPLRVLSVGRLDWRKGYEYGLEAIRLLVARGVDVRYRIVGDGDYAEAVAFARHQLELEPSVELLGARTSEEVREELCLADVFLHPAVSEGFSNAVLEAQAMGLPVVCTDAGGLPENVADGETGFVVPRRDPAALAEKLKELARDGALRRRMGEAGRERVLARFRIESQIEAFGHLYRGLLDGARAPATLPAEGR